MRYDYIRNKQRNNHCAKHRNSKSQIVEARINGVTATMNPSSVALSSGDQATITLTKTEGFVSGATYEFAFYTAIGNIFST